MKTRRIKESGLFYREKPLSDTAAERLQLASERIAQIREELGDGFVAGPDFCAFMGDADAFLLTALDEYHFLKEGGQDTADLLSLCERNRRLYDEIAKENYAESFANPAFAVTRLGPDYGPILSALFYELRSVIPYLYAGETEHMLIRLELFLEIYSAFEQASPELPPAQNLKKVIRSYLYDYAEYEAEYTISTKLVEPESHAARIIRGADLADLRYLYAYGDYVTENETGAAEFLNGLPEEKIARMADTYTEGYRIGFEMMGKDLSRKKYCSVYYHIGFERMMRRAFSNFEDMHLLPVVPYDVPSLFNLLRAERTGWCGAETNPQYLYDHREDLSLFMDGAYMKHRLETLKAAYRVHPETKYFAGPAVVEVFGAEPFAPESRKENARFDEKQTKEIADFTVQASILYSDAVVASERSFTIIDFPVQEIAPSNPALYREIFDAIIEINTLDYHKYQMIQSRLIDALNRADHVEVKGMNGNRTELTVQLTKLTDPAHQAIFENCVADVNIPVGEVFTTPVLEGTDGTLHVTGVYLGGLHFTDLWFQFVDGRVADYGCSNFKDPEEGRRYIEENILYHHEKLPMGECAIGTNTTAYTKARQYGIEDRLPILIAEKTGPHFAIGDTCYSHEEDNHYFNPDGKEIIAKDNSVSALRKEDPSGAYFGCHTDITIPYCELGSYIAVCEDGERIPILMNGRFVLPGTEELNDAFGEQKPSRRD